MRLRYQLLTMVLMLALTAVTIFAATAAAEATLLANYLRNGAGIVAATSIEMPTEWLVEDTKTPVGKVSVLCGFILAGVIEPNGEGAFTTALNLSKEALGTEELAGLALTCEAGQGCSVSTEESPIETWPVLLPWGITIFLMEDETFLLLVKVMHIEILCLVLNVMSEDLCETPDAELASENGVGGLMIPAGSQTGLVMTCTIGGSASGVYEIVISSPLQLVEGGTLTVSSE